jgi:hypothetical protein
MPTCSWCGEVRTDLGSEGPLRVCARCSKGAQSEWQLAPARVAEFEDEFQPRVAGWVRATALILLLAFVLPVVLLLWPV